MSYWGAQVIVNLFSSIPVIGEDLGVWIRGDYTISDITLNRFFAFHVVALPLVLLGLVAAHLMALHETGSNNPDGVEIKQQPKDPATGLPLDGIYHPYYTVKYWSAASFLRCWRSCSSARDGTFPGVQQLHPGRPAQDARAHRAGLHFTPYYAMLRGAVVPGLQVWGVIIMGLAVVIFFVLPWLDRGPVRSIRYRGTLYKAWIAVFVVSFLVLGYLGVVPVTIWGQFPESVPVVGGVDRATLVARIFTALYFAFFLLMPWYTRIDKTKPEPTRVTM
jgi:ubiquinol-cytochrome c reductase cytochrome b subunit